MVDFSVTLYCVFVISCLCVRLVDAEVPQYYVEDHCSQTLALNYGSVQAVRLKLTKTEIYPDGMRCAMRIQAPEGKKLVIRIENIDIMGTQESMCQDGDFLQIFDGPSESSISHPDMPSNLCSKPDVAHFSTSGRYLVLRFISNTDLLTGTGLKLTITAYSETPCAPDEFRCKSSAHCIKSTLRCNQLPSCPDGTDESMPDCLSTAAIVGISVGCVVVFAGVVITIVVFCVVRERRKRARIIKSFYNNGTTKITSQNQQQPGTSTLSSHSPSYSAKTTHWLQESTRTVSQKQGSTTTTTTTMVLPSKSSLTKNLPRQHGLSTNSVRSIQGSPLKSTSSQQGSLKHSTCRNEHESLPTQSNNDSPSTHSTSSYNEQHTESGFDVQGFKTELRSILTSLHRSENQSSTIKPGSSHQIPFTHQDVIKPGSSHQLPFTHQGVTKPGSSQQSTFLHEARNHPVKSTQSAFESQGFKKEPESSFHAPSTHKESESLDMITNLESILSTLPGFEKQMFDNNLEPDDQFDLPSPHTSEPMEYVNSGSWTESEYCNQSVSSHSGTSYQYLWKMSGTCEPPGSHSFKPPNLSSNNPIQQMSSESGWGNDSTSSF